MADEVHLIPDPDGGPNQYLDAVALSEGRVSVYGLKPGMSFAEFEADLAKAATAAERDRRPPRDLAKELDAALARIAALEARRASQ